MIFGALRILGIWRLSGLVLRKYARFPAVSLLLFAPSHHYIATNFNANTIQLSLWPWAAFFFVRSLQTNSWKHGLFFGALGGGALLGKYYSVLFLISCFIAALLHPNRRSYFRSAAPYCAVVTCAALCAPHAWWAWENGLTTVQYALSKSQRPWWVNTYSAVGTAVAGIATNAAGTVILLAALGRRWPALIPHIYRSWIARENRWLTVLALGPLVLTILLGIVGYIKITPNFLIPTVYMLPLMVCHGLGPALTGTRVRNITRWAATFMLLALAVAPIIAYTSVAFHFEDREQLSPQVARAATKAWHERMSTPLRISTGTEAFSLALPFYSPDTPAEFTRYSLEMAPWITPNRIAREGILYVCVVQDFTCLQAAKTYATTQTTQSSLMFQNTFWGLRGPVVEIILIMTPPNTQ